MMAADFFVGAVGRDAELQRAVVEEAPYPQMVDADSQLESAKSRMVEIDEKVHITSDTLLVESELLLDFFSPPALIWATARGWPTVRTVSIG